ncbi:RHS repeat protein [bacterium]|nr:RHS repeat protein [bacterium]
MAESDRDTQTPPQQAPLKPRKFSRWVAPVAVALAVLLAFVMLQQSRDYVPLPLPPDPAQLRAYPRVPTGWAAKAPMPLYVNAGRVSRGLSIPETGAFVHRQTDFYVNDVIPINFTRVQLQIDDYSRCFGLGATNYYDMFLVGDNAPFSYIELIKADAERVYFRRISSGIGYSDAVYRHDPGPHDSNHVFDWATIRWNGSAWDMRLSDGTIMRFPASKYAKTAGQAAVLFIQDKAGHRLTIDRDAQGNILKIVSPNGGALTFTHDSQNRITKGIDSYGHWITYSYDSENRLTAVHDSEQGVTRYVYGARNDITAIFKPDGEKWVSAAYDKNNRIVRITYDGKKWWLISYTLGDRGWIEATDSLGYDGVFERMTFDAAGDPLSDQVFYVGPNAPPLQTGPKANL